MIGSTESTESRGIKCEAEEGETVGNDEAIGLVKRPSREVHPSLSVSLAFTDWRTYGIPLPIHDPAVPSSSFSLVGTLTEHFRGHVSG